MITLSDAVRRIQTDHPNSRIAAAWEADDCYAFKLFRRDRVIKSIADIPSGSALYMVRKVDGSLFVYNPLRPGKRYKLREIDLSKHLSLKDAAFSQRYLSFFGDGTAWGQDELSHSLSTDELSHHGILGQKWGVRRGPPYPLDDAHRSSGKVRRQSDKAKKSGDTKSTVTTNGKEIAAKTKLPLKQAPTTIVEDIRDINPGRDEHDGDPKWDNNCTSCIIAFAARRRGLDVVAAPAPEDGRYIAEVQERCFKDGYTASDGAGKRDEGYHCYSRIFNRFRSAAWYEKDIARRINEQFSDPEDGAYGALDFHTREVGHVFAWYKEGGAVKFADPQGGVMGASKSFEHMAEQKGPIIAKAMRYDNRELNPDGILEFVESAHELKHCRNIGEYCITAILMANQ